MNIAGLVGIHLSLFCHRRMMNFFVSLMISFLPTVYGGIGFYALNGFPSGVQPVFLDTCAYNATNSRLCVTTNMYTFQNYALVFFETPSTSLYNLTATAYYYYPHPTEPSNNTLTSIHIDTYNITSYNFFLALYVDGITQPTPDQYDFSPALSGFRGPPAQTNAITLMTLNLYYTVNPLSTSVANIPAYYFYNLNDDNVYTAPATSDVSLMFLQSSTVEYIPSTMNGDGYYMYTSPFEAGWTFADGTTIQIISGGEVNCYRGQLFLNVAFGYEPPAGFSAASYFELISPPIIDHPPYPVPSMAPTFSQQPTSLPTQSDDDSNSSGFDNLSDGEKAGAIIAIIVAFNILVLLTYLAYRQFCATEKDSTKQDLIGNEYL